MESIKRIITIDLTEYGAEGTIEMRAPSLRKQNEFKNAMGKYLNLGSDRTFELRDDLPMGDLEIATMMQYVFKAPFRTTVAGFLDFTDEMEPEMASALFKRMSAGMQEIDGSSPFADSPSAESVNSV